MQTRSPSQLRQSGMTIVELIAVIVVSGVLATGVVTYVMQSAEGISSTASRNQLATVGRIAVDRLAMELNNALPNSIRHLNAGGRECIEFIPVRAATTYIDPPFTGLGGDEFDVVDFVPSQQGATDGYAVVYPNRIEQLYAGDIGLSSGWPEFADRGPIQSIDVITASAAANQTTIGLSKTHRFPRRSPTDRFFVVDDPVSFCIAGTNLYRYTNYGFYTSQVTMETPGACGERCLPNYTSAPDKMLITNSINSAESSFTVGQQTMTRNALIGINLTFAANGDSVMLSHEMMTRNVP